MMKELRAAVVRLFEEGKSKAYISRLLKVPVTTVKRDIQRFKETGNNNDRPGRGRKKTANTISNRKKIKRMIERNPKRSARKLAKVIKISTTTVRRILKNDLHLKPYKMQNAQLLTD